MDTFDQCALHACIEICTATKKLKLFSTSALHIFQIFPHIQDMI
jgi:hypothetical protein